MKLPKINANGMLDLHLIIKRYLKYLVKKIFKD